MRIQVSYVDLSRKLHEKYAVDNLPQLSQLIPVRRRWSSRRQYHTPGFYYFSTLKKHVFYESYLESKILLHFDFEGQVRHLVEQPFFLHHGESTHIPDFAMETTSGEHFVINVKPIAHLESRSAIYNFEIADEFARVRGWHHRNMHELQPQYIDNLQWLAGFRNTPFDVQNISEDIFKLLEDCRSLGEIVHQVGSALFVKPVVFHLLWHRQLSTDLEQRFSLEMPIWRGER